MSQSLSMLLQSPLSVDRLGIHTFFHLLAFPVCYESCTQVLQQQGCQSTDGNRACSSFNHLLLRGPLRLFWLFL